MNQEISPWSFYETKLNKLGPKAITLNHKGSNNPRTNKYLGNKTTSLRAYEGSAQSNQAASQAITASELLFTLKMMFYEIQSEDEPKYKLPLMSNRLIVQGRGDKFKKDWSLKYFLNENM